MRRTLVIAALAAVPARASAGQATCSNPGLPIGAAASSDLLPGRLTLNLTTGFLPIRSEEVVGTGPSPVHAEYLYEPDPAEILHHLLPQYVITKVYAAMLEGAASENAARRRAMKAATENAEEIIKILTRQANRARQDEITTEISEIVGGAEALSAAGE